MMASVGTAASAEGPPALRLPSCAVLGRRLSFTAPLFTVLQSLRVRTGLGSATVSQSTFDSIHWPPSTLFRNLFSYRPFPPYYRSFAIGAHVTTGAPIPIFPIHLMTFTFHPPYAGVPAGSRERHRVSTSDWLATNIHNTEHSAHCHVGQLPVSDKHSIKSALTRIPQACDCVASP